MITLCNPLYCWSGDSHWQGQSVGHPLSFFQTSAFRWGPLQAASWHVGQFKAGHREKVFPETLAAKHLWLRRQLHVLCRFSRHCRRRTRSSCATWKCFKWFEHPLTSGCTGGEVSWELCFSEPASLCRCHTLHSLQSEERLLWNGLCQTRIGFHIHCTASICIRVFCVYDSYAEGLVKSRPLSPQWEQPGWPGQSPSFHWTPQQPLSKTKSPWGAKYIYSRVV